MSVTVAHCVFFFVCFVFVFCFFFFFGGGGGAWGRGRGEGAGGWLTALSRIFRLYRADRSIVSSLIH